MHYPHDHEYPLYKQIVTEEMQIIPKEMFEKQQHMFLQPQQTEYEPNMLQQVPEYCPENEHYFQKEFHSWEQNCSCRILPPDYPSPVEYLPVMSHNDCIQMVYTNPHSSQNNIYSDMSPPYPPPSNIDDFPVWLKIYSKASIECDHKLHWDMFNIRDLYFFDNILVKLYEHDIEDVILWYKSYKNALLREMDERLLQENRQRQRILLYNNP